MIKKTKEKEMVNLQKALRCAFLLFLLVGGQSFVFSNDTVKSLVDIKANAGLMGNGEVNENSVDDVSRRCRKHIKLSYHLFISEFIASFIEIPTSNVSDDSTTIASSYLAGRAPLYNKHGEKVGICSASFLNMQTADGIFTDISNYLSVDNGLIVTWFSPTTPINLELDSIVHSMVTECIVDASTKIGQNPFYGKVFNMIVSSDDEKIYFKLTEI